MRLRMRSPCSRVGVRVRCVCVAARRPLVDEEEGIRKKSKKGLGAGFAGLGASVLSADVESVYRPASRETRAVYETLLTFLQQEMGDKSVDNSRGASSEVREILHEWRSDSVAAVCVRICVRVSAGLTTFLRPAPMR